MSAVNWHDVAYGAVLFAGTGFFGCIGSALWLVALERLLTIFKLKRLVLVGAWHEKHCREPKIITKKSDHPTNRREP